MFLECKYVPINSKELFPRVVLKSYVNQPSFFINETYLITKIDLLKDLIVFDHKDNHSFSEIKSLVESDKLKIVKCFVVDSMQSMFLYDEVIVEFTNGYQPTGEYIHGILTELAIEEPYCKINDLPVDLASEGHSSQMYKVVAAINPEI